MANKVVNYKKFRTDIINGKKRCIYMKPKGKREYVKSKGEFVLLSVYIKKMQKKMKIKGGVLSCFGFGCKQNSKINSKINSKNSPTVTAELVFDNTGADDDRTHIVPPPNTPRVVSSKWGMLMSTTHNKPYFFNRHTGERRWDLPEDAMVSPRIREYYNKTSKPPTKTTSIYVNDDSGVSTVFNRGTVLQRVKAIQQGNIIK